MSITTDPHPPATRNIQTGDHSVATCRGVSGDNPDLSGIVEQHRVAAVLDSLPGMERLVFVMRIFGAKTQSQIASSLGIAPDEVYRLLDKSLTTLRDQLYQPNR